MFIVVMHTLLTILMYVAGATWLGRLIYWMIQPFILEWDRDNRSLVTIVFTSTYPFIVAVTGLVHLIWASLCIFLISAGDAYQGYLGGTSDGTGIFLWIGLAVTGMIVLGYGARLCEKEG